MPKAIFHSGKLEKEKKKQGRLCVREAGMVGTAV